MALFTGIKCIGGRYEHPFHEQGDSATKVYQLRCICHVDQYTPLALDSLMTNAGTAGVDVLPAGFGDAAAYFVGDSTPEPFKGPLVQFMRSFANIPAAREEQTGTYTYKFPGGTSARVFEPAVTGQSSSQPGGIYQVTVTLSPGDAAEFSDGDSCVIYNDANWSWASGGVTVSWSSMYGLCTVSGNNITLTQSTSQPTVSSNSGTFTIKKIIAAGRSEAKSLNAASYNFIRYVKTSTPAGESLAAEFKIYGLLGAETDILLSNTWPYNAAAYQDLVSAGSYIPATPESIARWRGNIYQITQQMVKAT